MELFDMPALLGANAYPGRGIILGLCPDGHTAALAYFIMGRSENSRNRAFVRKGGDVGIHVLDSAKLADPALILYAPVRTLMRTVIVTNGDQTDTIAEAVLAGRTFEQALETRRFEPDAPHFTPRISGMLRFSPAFSYKLSILKAGDGEGKTTFRQVFGYEPMEGVGHFIHTYQKDATPLPSFSGEPVPVRIPADLDGFTKALWNGLHPENKVALYVRYTDVTSGAYRDALYNKYASED
ncbi:MAG: inosine monophosphate cyclohydrolase [Clostridia bacterium]|nr:inosine monophosphate cyclohydrolase [Clostridia bacterium]